MYLCLLRRQLVRELPREVVVYDCHELTTNSKLTREDGKGAKAESSLLVEEQPQRAFHRPRDDLDAGSCEGVLVKTIISYSQT